MEGRDSGQAGMTTFNATLGLFSGRGGFTLIELLVVIAILAIIAGIGFSLDGWQNQSRTEAQIKQIYSDIMNARQKAVAQKRWFFVEFAVNNGLYSYNIYADTNPAPDGDGAYEAGDAPAGPYWNIAAEKPVIQVNGAQNPFQLNISPDGVLSGMVPGVPASGVTSGTVYISSNNAPQLNCLYWSAANTALGQWNAGTDNCDAK